MESEEVYILDYLRSPIGSFMGSLSALSAVELGSQTLTALLKRQHISPQLINELILGNVVSAGLGQAPARQVALRSGLSTSTVCTTINKVCASGTKAITLAAQSIQLGLNDIVVAGGVESMSNIPFYMHQVRKAHKMGNQVLEDGILKDALMDVFSQEHMGKVSEMTAKKMNIDRMQQDDYALQSYHKAQNAWKMNWFDQEITPMELLKNKTLQFVSKDEEPDLLMEDKLRILKPVFDPEGTITAANASKINDGAAMFILISGSKLKALGLQAKAKIISYADAETLPEDFGIAPSLSIPKALKNTPLNIKDIDLWEINEAFALVPIANANLLNIPMEKLNVWGGAIALGHPLGASGARIVCTLLNALHTTSKQHGVAAICNGGGGSTALLVENLM